MAVNDASNADCILPDEFKYSVIIFKSDVSALNSWLQWAKQLSRRGLEVCMGTLDRLYSVEATVL